MVLWYLFSDLSFLDVFFFVYTVYVFSVFAIFTYTLAFCWFSIFSFIFSGLYMSIRCDFSIL